MSRIPSHRQSSPRRATWLKRFRKRTKSRKTTALLMERLEERMLLTTVPLLDDLANDLADHRTLPAGASETGEFQ